MANRKISDLTALTAPATGDLLPIVDISEAAAADKNKKITYGELLASAPAGSAAAPSFSFDGDPNSGLYSAGADQVAISTGGTGRLFVDASGNVGIGASPGYALDVISQDTTASLGYALRLRTNTTAGAAAIQFTNLGVSAQYGVIACDSSSNLKFFTGATEAMRIDSSGRLGIGTSAPSDLLHLGSGNARIGKWESGGSTVFVSAGIGTTSSPAFGSLSFIGYSGTSADVVKGRIKSADVSINNNTIGSLLFEVQTGASTITEAMRIDSSARLLVGTSTANTSGAKLQTSDGLTFPATAVASADPNTLDDYEEGTWTAAITAFGGGSQTYTMGAASASYIKIGNLVKLSGRLEWTYTAGGSPSNSCVINLPFNAGSTNYQFRSSNVVSTYNGFMALTRESATSVYIGSNLSANGGGMLFDFTYIIAF
jgi:hypothetical protein